MTVQRVGLSEGLAPIDKEEALTSFFGVPNPSPDTTNVNSYFQYYVRELELFQTQCDWRLVPSPQVFTKHVDVQQLFKDSRGRDDLSRADVVQTLVTKYPNANQDEIQTMVELSLRLGLLLNVRKESVDRTTRATPSLNWADDQKLGDFISGLFPASRWNLTANESRIHPLFTAAFMRRICSLRIEFTDCLANHLHLLREPKENILKVFPHKFVVSSILKHTDWAAQAANTGNKSATIPKKVLEEVIMSLNLLFPHQDSGTNTLLAKHAHPQNFHTYEPFRGPPTLNLMEFDHFRDRLLELHEVVFSSPPASWRQLFLDRRNPTQFWTFWLAILILILTVVGTAASVYQAVKS